MLNTVLEFSARFEDIFVIIGIVSAVVFVASLLLTPFLLGLIPQDYFTDNYSQNHQRISIFTWIKIALKTLVGLVFLLAGLVMLVTPGQGLIAILLGLFLMQFPGKRALELRLVHHNPTFKALNWLRNKAGKPPFLR